MRRFPSRRAWLLRGATVLLVMATLVLWADAKEVIPPAPSDHFHDDAGVASPAVAARLNETLAQFERETSEHLVMVVYPKMQSDSYVGDYVQRVSQAWRLAANSAVFFVFMEDRKTFLIAGDGLRSAFRDDTIIGIASRVIAVPLNDAEYDKGFSLGVDAMISAVRDQQGAARLFWLLLLILPVGALAVWRLRKTA